ncbi:MAG: hypothetical protein F6K55_03230 [Moorea sp. SIO4A3]|nr:hypothetical protein [Moorena sp. SIO4A3]
MFPHNKILPKHMTAIRRDTRKYIDRSPVSHGSSLGDKRFDLPLLLPYQQEYFQTVLDNPVTTVIKARQTGYTFVDAAIAVWMASQSQNSKYGTSQLYLGYNLIISREYVKLCKWWAKQFQLVYSEINEVAYHDEDKDFMVFRLEFASGHYIEALPSRATVLRGRRASVCLDECCYHQDLDEVLRSVFALLMWGKTRIRLISTPSEIGDPFYEIIQKIKKGEKEYALISCPFDKAIEQGLYKRICIVNGLNWSKQAEIAWAKEIEKIYEPYERTELYCEFIDVLGGNIFTKEDFKYITWEEFTEVELENECLSFDLATTGKELGDRKNEPFYTFGVHMGYSDNKYYVIDTIFAQADAKSGDDLMKSWAKSKNEYRPISLLIEQEPGSSGAKYIQQLKDDIPMINVIGCPPKGKKITRAMPFRNTAHAGRVFVLPFTSRDRVIAGLGSWKGTPEPFKSDAVDAFSQAFHWLMNTMPRQIPIGGKRIW